MTSTPQAPDLDGRNGEPLAGAAHRIVRWYEEVGLAMASGIVCWLLSCLVEPARSVAHGFGIQWATMSEDPFAFTGQLPHRLLTPLLANVLGLTGVSYTDFTRLSGAVMLALVFFVARKRGALRLDALLITLAIAFTGAVQIYKRGMIGYCDNVGFSLFAIAWLCRRNGFVFWPVWLLNLVNHDMAAFFLPWAWFLRREVGALRRWDVLAAVLVLAAYWGYRRYVAAHAAAWEYNEGYFLANCFLPFHFVWLWFLAVCHLLLQFGPMLVVLGWHSCREWPERERTGTLLLLLGMGGVFCFAYDVMRHSNLIFLPIVFASTRFLVDLRSRAAYLFLIALTIWSYREFSWQPATEDPWVFQSPGWMFDRLTGVLVMQNEGHRLIRPEFRFDLSVQWDVLTKSVPVLQSELWGLAFGSLGIVAVARWLWRNDVGGPDWRRARA